MTKKLGGGHRFCSQCGKTIFGSVGCKYSRECPVCCGEGIYISEAISRIHDFEIDKEKDKCTTCGGTGKLKLR